MFLNMSTRMLFYNLMLLFFSYYLFRKLIHSSTLIPHCNLLMITVHVAFLVLLHEDSYSKSDCTLVNSLHILHLVPQVGTDDVLNIRVLCSLYRVNCICTGLDDALTSGLSV